MRPSKRQSAQKQKAETKLMSSWIDLTRTLTNGIIHWPGEGPFQWERIADISGPGTCNVSRICTSVHMGTHIDAPLHFINDGIDISEVPLAKLCGRAVLVDIPEERDVTAEDLEAAGIASGERVLLRTANQELWDKPDFDEGYYALTAEAAMWLVDQEVPLVGIDYLSVDRIDNEEKPAHYALLGNGVIIVEGLDLSALEPGRYEVVALPLKIANSDGSPARVIARALEK